MKKLQRKVAILTGATGGLGKGVLPVFINEGASVACTYVVDSEYEYCQGEYAQNNENIIFLKADVTNNDDVRKVISETKKKFGRIDFLVNMVGGFLYNDFLKTTNEDFDRMIEINLKSCFIFSREILPTFIENNSGRIVNISAKPAIKGVSGMSAYGAAKSAVATLTESIADEVKDYNINVNAIIPGTIDTEQNRKDMPDKDFSKLVNPQDIANVIVYLCSEESNIIRGAVIPALGQTY